MCMRFFVAVMIFMLAIASEVNAGAVNLKNVDAIYKGHLRDHYLKCLNEGVRIKTENPDAEFSEAKCLRSYMSIEVTNSEFDDKISVSANATAIDSYDAPAPILINLHCAAKFSQISFFTEFPHHGLKDVVPMTYRLGKQPAKSIGVNAETSNGVVVFSLGKDDERAFLEDLASKDNSPLLVRIEASNTFQARFKLKNLTQAVKDFTAVCAELN